MELLLTRRRRKGHTQYLVKSRGYPHSQNSWEYKVTSGMISLTSLTLLIALINSGDVRHTTLPGTSRWEAKVSRTATALT